MPTVAAETGLLYKGIQWLWVVLFPLLFGWWLKDREARKQEERVRDARLVKAEKDISKHSNDLKNLSEAYGRQETKLDSILYKIEESKSQQDKYFAVFDYINKNEGDK